MTLDEQIEYLIDRRNYPFVKIRLKVYENILASLEELKQIKEPKEYGCYCDIESMPEGFKPDKCVWDTGNIGDCIYASQGTKKENCKYWKPIG